MTASASRAERSARPTEPASASGCASSASIPRIPAGDSDSAPSAQAGHTAPPELVEETGQRLEPARVAFLLGEQAQHRLSADEPDREPVRMLPRGAMRADEL